MPFETHAREDADHWASQLARAALPKKLPEDARAVYRRALITILQHRVDNGAFLAGSTLTSPVYKLVWPRDGSKTAIDMLDAGFVPEAKAFFERLETMLLADGSFAVNYHPDASGPFFDFGRGGNENDQPGMLPWGVARILDATGDTLWTAERWPAVRRVVDHLLAITARGLVDPSRDLWELETGSSWTYANAAVVAGLEAAAKIARVAGASGDAYEARAKRVRAAMDAELVTAQGWFGRGKKDGRVDARLEIANLALGRGGFAILDDRDPRVAGVGDAVAQRLVTPGGGVRRYDGDRYYGGQPWPVASAWLALHMLGRGERARAERLFGVMTAQARATDTLMLGEQFEETKKVWFSAVPLVWSEAAYLRTARALYE
jgi:glucoamylase